MSTDKASHTPGKLTVNESGRLYSAKFSPYGGTIKIHSPWVEDAWDGDEEADANMRRIAACWNFCEGLSADDLSKDFATYVSEQAYITGLNPAQGGMDMGLNGIAVQVLAASFAGQFKGSGATNYLEVRMHHAEVGNLLVTLQRLDGKSPAQFRADAEVQRDELLAALKTIVECGGIGPESMFHAARAAIAKAEQL